MGRLDMTECGITGTKSQQRVSVLLTMARLNLSRHLMCTWMFLWCGNQDLSVHFLNLTVSSMGFLLASTLPLTTGPRSLFTASGVMRPRFLSTVGKPSTYHERLEVPSFHQWTFFSLLDGLWMS